MLSFSLYHRSHGRIPTSLSCLLRANPLVRSISSLDYPNHKFLVKTKAPTSRARTGEIHTPHGIVETPNFIFCGTKAVIKAITTEQLRNEGAQIMLSNTFHLMLQPGSELIQKMGGLQKATGWNGPMFTDSGGYQVFSMGFGSVSNEIKRRSNQPKDKNPQKSSNSTLLTSQTEHEHNQTNLIPTTKEKEKEPQTFKKTIQEINEEGALFISFYDQSKKLLTPELSMQIQRQLGADLVVAFDECTPFNIPKEYTAESMHRSHRWELRSLEEFARTHDGSQAMYGIIQGGIYSDLRAQSCQFVNDHGFFGSAIGGSLGATKEDMYSVVEYTAQRLREDRPIHLLGIGGIRDIFYGVRQGIDTFDCVHPTRIGRHGGALVKASYWEEERQQDPNLQPRIFHSSEVIGFNNRKQKRLLRSNERLKSFQKKLQQLTSQLQDEQQHPEHEELTESQQILQTNRIEQLQTNIEATQQLIQQTQKQIHEEEQRTLVIKTKPMVVREHINLCNAKYREDLRPIESDCQCYTCRTHSRAYLHHLFRIDETLSGSLVTLHNVHYMSKLMKDIRSGINTNTLEEIEKKYIHPELIHDDHQIDNTENNLLKEEEINEDHRLTKSKPSIQ